MNGVCAVDFALDVEFTLNKIVHLEDIALQNAAD